MPHAVTKGTGLQALILCGPGSSFPTFTANPDENPKALLPIANRPMVWYPLDFCNRAGITDITLICPPSASEAIKAALSTNPFLTSLPAPSVLAPPDLDQTTGTAAILRLPEVRALVTADFLVLPCDLVCELGGEKLLQAWMVKAASLADLLQDQGLGRYFLSEGGANANANASPSTRNGNGFATHSGGLGVWYDTRTGIPAVKSEEKDFVATVPLSKESSQAATDAKTTATSVVAHLERVVTAMPTDSLNDVTEAKNGYPTRQGLLRRHRGLRMRTTHRDAHIYVFPHWVMDFVQANEHMDSIGEDVLGWWAKAEWQHGLPEKLGVGKALQTYCAPAGGGNSDSSSSTGGHNGPDGADGADGADGVDGARHQSSASPGRSRGQWARSLTSGAGPTSAAATLVSSAPLTTPAADLENAGAAQASTAAAAAADHDQRQQMPPLLAYVHPSAATAPLIRRVDTSQLLLTVSLQLAKLPSVEEMALAAGVPADSAAALALASPFAHTKKVAYPEGVKPRTTVTRPDSLVADNVTVEEKVSIKECVIGANCQIQEGAKLHQCLLMEGVVVGKGARLTRCILGKRSEIGAQSVLVDCEVQENLLVEPKTEEKDNNFMSSEGLEATAEEMDEAMQDVSDDDVAVAGA
ncbi:translation initiation factor eIF-2B subunit gamma [Sporothrix schenckii 1099-18]|uniref:Mannose-1-phosphate guanyltransferase n=1 Tax=Sporothrix schenckii 1099-18 TaxID=1397361 RepID=A0A0F2M6Q8_SPOSC|nr:translation initiation factor eIF-2B subunit gamma [Sporothrix schenckii 1099-18]KJR83856.1 translation initiation factor eIF-2B subunit gamma [Sporothrix schenckii 1099-18]